ncbi:unnamed protein product [Parnassius apollo]|uniref:(apollo) hypothetical protein n=1 Tax=Parnassius apollo TaxID=110799 RepID=A0A8S3WBQ0_PARAO|nr:unnamed protein product [Parnassius apollo]
MEKAKAYIKSSLGASKPASPARDAAEAEPRVCFVCGGAGLGDCYTVRVKPGPQSSEPYFPFLGAHPPPAGYRADDSEEEGTVRCCCVCYTFLRQQWEQYDRENKPHSQRFYWMKRLDGKPFIGADMSFQGEYAAQVLGLGAETGGRDESGTPGAVGATSATAARAAEPPPPAPPTTTTSAALPTTPRPKDLDTNHNAKFNNQRYAGGEEEGVLDLRARDPSVISVGSQHSGVSEPVGFLDAVRSTVSVYSGNSNSSSDRDILDLSMPDKNSMTEVCYVCGDEYKRGTLCNLNTKEPKDKMDASVNASERTVRRKLKELDFKACRPARKPKLTAAMKAKRLKWAKQWQDKDVDFWRSVCFSDESTFEILQNKAQYVRRRHGEKFHPDCVVPTVKYPTKVMIWSAISGKGTGRLYVVKGIMRQDQYKEVLENRLIPQLREWFPNGEPFTFMQDGAPCHTARSVKAFLAEKNIPLLDWPGNSPDMNPIEKCVGADEKRSGKDVITNKTQLLEKIIYVWNHHPQMQETVQSCIDSMPRRIKALIAAKGGSTKY